MSVNYYYLVSGLPDIVIEGGKGLPSVKEFTGEISDMLNPEDKPLLNLAFAPVDNRNLVSVIEKQEDRFDDRGFWSMNALQEEIGTPDLVPGYMKKFIDSYKNDSLPSGGKTLIDKLNVFFYDEVLNNSNTFISEWFEFELNLRNILAALNCRRNSKSGSDGEDGVFSLETAIIGSNEVALSLKRSSAQDFGVASQFPWIEKILNMDYSNLVEYEKGIDFLRWEVLDEMTTFSYFQIDTLLAFCIKLQIVERWGALDPESGRERFSHLVEEILSGVSVAEEF